MLLVLRTEATVVGTAVLHLCRELQCYGTRLVVLEGVDLALGIWRDQGLEPPVGGPPLAHDDPTILQVNLGIYHLLAHRAKATGQLIEDGVGGALLGYISTRLHWLTPLLRVIDFQDATRNRRIVLSI